MALILNTEQLKKYVDVHKQTHWDTLRLFVEQAEDTYILPLIGSGIFVFLKAIVESPGFDPDNSFNDPLYKSLYTRLCRALAHYTMYEGLPFLNTPVGDQGVMQQSSKEGTATPAAQWRYESRRAAHLDNADRFADQLLEFMESNADAFPDWKASPSYTVTKDLFLPNSKTLSVYLNSQGSRRAYLAMRPWIRLAEKKYIIPAIGQQLFSEIKSELLNGAVSDANTVLLRYIQEACAWASYWEALPNLPLKITCEGFLIKSVADGIHTVSGANDRDKQQAYDSARGNMDTFLSSLKRFIDAHIDDYPLYRDDPASGNKQPSYKLKDNKKCSGQFRV